MAHKKQKHSKLSNKFTQAIEAKMPKQDAFKRKYPWDSDMAKNIIEKVIALIALDDQLISMVEDQGFLVI